MHGWSSFCGDEASCPAKLILFRRKGVHKPMSIRTIGSRIGLLPRPWVFVPCTLVTRTSFPAVHAEELSWNVLRTRRKRVRFHPAPARAPPRPSPAARPAPRPACARTASAHRGPRAPWLSVRCVGIAPRLPPTAPRPLLFAKPVRGHFPKSTHNIRSTTNIYD